MSKLFALFFVILSLICTIQCAPSPVRRNYPSPTPKGDGLVARGHCDYVCPLENLAGTELSRMHTNSGRLYCKYNVEADDDAFCLYNRVKFI